MNDNLVYFDKLPLQPVVELPCPRCGCPQSLRIGQVTVRGKLRWFESINCRKCGVSSEADGVGFPSPEIRELLIEKNGEWQVTLKNVRSIACVVKVLQAELSLDMRVTIDFLKKESREIFRGTKSEAMWLTGLLESSGEFPVVALLQVDSEV